MPAPAFVARPGHELIPTDMHFVVIVPEPLLDSARFLRIHNRVSKEAVRAVLFSHRLKRIPEHFKQTNRAKYDHMPRKDRTKERKRRKFGSITDLKKSGRTKAAMSSEHPEIRVGGTAETVLIGRMFLKFPFPANVEDNEGHGVTIAQMAKEIGAWTDQESNDAAEEYEKFYAGELEKALESSPKLRAKAGI